MNNVPYLSCTVYLISFRVPVYRVPFYLACTRVPFLLSCTVYLPSTGLSTGHFSLLRAAVFNFCDMGILPNEMYTHPYLIIRGNTQLTGPFPYSGPLPIGLTHYLKVGVLILIYLKAPVSLAISVTYSTGYLCHLLSILFSYSLSIDYNYWTSDLVCINIIIIIH